jgi:GNAT superfamily N-acetyltransferase
MTDADTTKSKWSVRKYQDGDEEQIRALRAVALSSAKDKQWWRWQYLDNPRGPAIIYLAEANKRILGHLALLPTLMKIGDKIIQCSQAVDGMVHPDYRRQGMYVKIADKTFEFANKDGIAMVFGTPNNQSYPIHVGRLQWIYICNPRLMLKIIDWGDLLKRRLRIPGFIGKQLEKFLELIWNNKSRCENSEVKIEQITSFDERIDRFWLRASEIKNVMVIRDNKYLNWRYVNKPGNNYKTFIALKGNEIIGYIVITIQREKTIRGNIIDFLALPGEDTALFMLIERAITYLKNKGAVSVTCLMFRETPYYRVLKKMGFIGRKSKCRLCARILDPSISKEFVSDPNNWYFSLGDRDVI